VRLRGQVVDAATGRPVAGAVVVLGAMPAQTNAQGFFSVRNVLSGGSYPVTVRADGFQELSQPVRLVAWGTASARLKVQPEGHPALSASVARTRWVNQRSGLLAATLRVTNTGAAEAKEARLTIGSSAATLVSQEPAQLGSMPAGAVRGVQVVLRLRRGHGESGVPLAVSLAFGRENGEEQTAQVELAALPPGAVAPAAAAGEPPVATPSTPRAVTREAPTSKQPAAAAGAAAALSPTVAQPKPAAPPAPAEKAPAPAKAERKESAGPNEASPPTPSPPSPPPAATPPPPTPGEEKPSAPPEPAKEEAEPKEEPKETEAEG
jgi:hypothetical protein